MGNKGWNPAPGQSDYPMEPVEVEYNGPKRVSGIQLQGDESGNAVSEFKLAYTNSRSAKYNYIPNSQTDSSAKVKKTNILINNTD